MILVEYKTMISRVEGTQRHAGSKVCPGLLPTLTGAKFRISVRAPWSIGTPRDRATDVFEGVLRRSLFCSRLICAKALKSEHYCKRVLALRVFGALALSIWQLLEIGVGTDMTLIVQARPTITVSLCFRGRYTPPAGRDCKNR